MPIANRTKSAWTLVALLVTIIVVAMLNLGMNVVANSGPSGPLPLDISMDGQLFGIHSEDSMGLKPSVQLVRLQPEEVKVRLALPLLHARAVPEDVKVIGLVPPDQYQYSNQTQFVGELIARKLESITAMFRWREVLESYMINKLQNLSLQQSFDVNMHFKDIWAQADAFITERELFPETKDFQSILGALRVAPAINGSNPSRNTERRVYVRQMYSNALRILAS